MPAILYPTHPARLAYSVSPWTDPTGKQWLWDGSKLRWSALVLPGPKGVSITSGTTPPTDPEEGDPWFDTEAGTLAVWSEAQATWIETSGPAGPEGTTESILEKLAGASPVESKIGPEYLPGALSGIATALGIPTRDHLTHANDTLEIGKPFYNAALAKLDITTA